MSDPPVLPEVRVATELPLNDDGDVPIPPVDPADLRTVWVMMDESEKELKKVIPDYDGGKAACELSDDFFRALSPGANAVAVYYRWARLELLQRINRKSGGRRLPGLMDGKPSDAVFKVFAIMPLTTPGASGARTFDPEELIRLIKEAESTSID